MWVHMRVGFSASDAALGDKFEWEMQAVIHWLCLLNCERIDHWLSLEYIKSLNCL